MVKFSKFLKMQSLQLKAAFSLVELSIVVLIIALLIGGVSQGIDLYSDMNIAKAKSLTQNSRVGRTPGLALWIESVSDKSFLKTEAIDGSIINTWFDLNFQYTGTATITSGGSIKPVYRFKGINNLPSLYFGGNGGFDIVHKNLTADNFKTIFLVLHRMAFSQINYVYDNSNCSSQYAFILGSDNKGTLHSGISFSGGDFSQNQNKPFIITTVHDTANSFFRYNGNQTNKTNSGNNKINLSTRLGASCIGYGDSQSYKGLIGEFIIFDRVLNIVEYKDIEDYLAKKWSINIIK